MAWEVGASPGPGGWTKWRQGCGMGCPDGGESFPTGSDARLHLLRSGHRIFRRNLDHAYSKVAHIERGVSMRIVAIIANLSLLAGLAYMLAEVGFPKPHEATFVLLIFLAPVASLIAFWLDSRQGKARNREDSTLQLARKAVRAKLRRAAQEK